MGLAHEEAEKGYRLAEVPVGAVLVGRMDKSSQGHTTCRLHQMTPRRMPKSWQSGGPPPRVGNYRLPETVLYVTLEPCAMCVGAMLHARVRRLVFGARDPRSGAAGSVLDLTGIGRFNHRIDVTGGVLAERCAEILHRFFKGAAGLKNA